MNLLQKKSVLTTEWRSPASSLAMFLSLLPTASLSAADLQDEETDFLGQNDQAQSSHWLSTVIVPVMPVI